MTSHRVHVHNAENPRFALGHTWWENTHATNCGLPCAYSDGSRAKLATGWVSAPVWAIDCPKCDPRYK